jgi:hypothetical protein
MAGLGALLRPLINFLSRLKTAAKIAGEVANFFKTSGLLAKILGHIGPMRFFSMLYFFRSFPFYPLEGGKNNTTECLSASTASEEIPGAHLSRRVLVLSAAASADKKNT